VLLDLVVYHSSHCSRIRTTYAFALPVLLLDLPLLPYVPYLPLLLLLLLRLAVQWRGQLHPHPTDWGRQSTADGVQQ
jgi:hypothetical protein